jgi:RsmE family RNA methyltransferase
LEIRQPVPLAEALRNAPQSAARWVCRPDGERWGRDGSRGAKGPAVAVVGPSSGFTDVELNALSEGGFAHLSLAGARLRTETAAVAMAALWAAADNA